MSASNDTHDQSLFRYPLLWGGLLLAALLYLCGMNWGMPHTVTWAADELVPHLVQGALAANFSEGWHTQYPPLHFMLIAILHIPFEPLIDDQELSLMLVGRLLSVVMALGSLLLLFLLAKRCVPAPWAVLAVVLFAFTPQAVYYAKMANLDIPYTFWLLWSLLMFWKVLEGHQRRDYFLCTLFAMMAICTKEQVYGFFVLLVPLLFLSRVRSPLVRNPWFDTTLLGCAGIAILSFVLFQNLIFNAEGFLNHFTLITGEKFQGFAMFKPNLSGHWGFLLLTIEQLAFVAGIPVLIAACVGVVLTLVRKEQHRWLLLPIVSYQIFLLHVVLFAYDRFFIPVVALLSIFAAYAMWSVYQRAPRVALSIAVLLPVWQFARGAELDLMMLHDTRYAAEAWLAKHAPEEKVIGLFGQRRYLPRHRHYPTRVTISPWPGAFRHLNPQPDCVLMRYAPSHRWHRMHPGRLFMEAVENGSLGLKEAFSVEERRLGRVFFDPKVFLGRPQHHTSNLSKISPDMKIYSRGENCLPTADQS